VTITIDPRLLADWKDGVWYMPGSEYGLGRNAEDLGTIVSIPMAARKWRD
jgi:beta-glucosidase